MAQSMLEQRLRSLADAITANDQDTADRLVEALRNINGVTYSDLRRLGIVRIATTGKPAWTFAAPDEQRQMRHGRYFDVSWHVAPPAPEPIAAVATAATRRPTAAELREQGYRDGARDARLGQYIPRRRRSKRYMDGYGQAHTDHHKIGPAPLAKAPHLRVVS